MTISPADAAIAATQRMASNLTDGLRRLSPGQQNFLWMILDKGVRLTAGVLVTLLVARYLGPSRFGLLAYAATLVALLLPLAELGVDAVVRRKLLALPEEAGRWLGLVWRLRLLAGVVLYAAMAAWLSVSRDDVSANHLIWILALSLLQPAGMTADIWLQANLKARRAAVASWVTLGLGAGARLYLVAVAADLTAFAWTAVVEGAMNCLLIWLAARQAGMPRPAGGSPWVATRDLLGQAWPLLLAGLTVALYMRIDLVMLRQLSGDHQAGTYAAVVRLSELWYFVPTALASSVLPRLLEQQRAGPETYLRGLQQYYDLSAGLAYVAALFTCLLAGPLVRLAYGTEYVEAIPILRWHAWAVVFVFLGVARSQYLINEKLTRFHLAATASGAVLNIALNLYLIPKHGAVGAVWATLSAYALAAWGATWLHPRLRENARLQTRALLVPVLGWRHFSRQ